MSVSRILQMGFAVAACVLLTGGFYVPSSRAVGELSVDDLFVSHNGELAVLSPKRTSRWQVSSPFVSWEGEYLAYSLDKNQMKVYFARETGEATQWVIEILKKLEPEEARGLKGEGRLLDGPEGFVIRISAKSGPYAGHYLAKGAAPAIEGSPWPLALTKDVRQALALTYVVREHTPKQHPFRRS